MTAHDLVGLLAETTLAGSAAVLLALLLRRPLRVRFGAGTAYGVWLLVPAATMAVLLPAATVPAVQVSMVHAGESGMAASVRAVAAVDPAPWVVVLWALGACLLASRFAWHQRRFLRGLGRLRPRGDGLFEAEAVAGLPAAIGLLRPRIVLPVDYRERYSQEQQALLQFHERTHLARGDLPVNALALLLRCLFWFNPLLHHAARYFRHDQELACDARVLARYPQSRRAYGEAMLKAQLAAQALPLGCHWGSSHPLRERIEMLKQPIPSPSRWRAGAVLVVTLALAAGYAAWAAQPGRAEQGPPVDVRMQLQWNGQTVATPRVIQPSGKPFTLRSGDGDEAILIEMAATARGDGTIALAGDIRRGDGLLGQPELILADGREAVIELGSTGGPGGDALLRLVVDASTAHDRVLPPPAAAKSIGDARAPAPVAAARPGHPPVYPRAALAQRIGGKVVLHVDVDAQGAVTGVEVASSEPAGVFEQAAIEAVREWRLQPGMHEGVAVPGRVQVPIEFRPDGPPPAAPASAPNA